MHAAFLLDPRLKKLMPEVAVQNTVVLSGTVDTPNARRAAEGDAQDTMGVWNVRDEVLVQPVGKPTDFDIERAVRRELAEDIFLPDGKSIRVSSAKGKIALRGSRLDKEVHVSFSGSEGIIGRHKGIRLAGEP
ncbi:MAG: BON domain-containing protein [Polyangiaceae bacterium]